MPSLITPPLTVINRRFCIAPMIDWSDRHCRYFWRLLTQHSLMYTEMITTGALLYGDVERHLKYNSEEHPLAIQLGGSNPADLAACARMAEDWGYDEVNLNCGCPSDRVQSGKFGACLMAEPELVAECFTQMQQSVDIPVTIKHRIGIDDQDEYKDLEKFVRVLQTAGCNTFIVHARKAWLQGLSPKQNREVPPLMYERVYQLKRENPELEIIINGGIQTLEDAQQHLQHVDGVMMGREAYQNPYILADIDALFFGQNYPKVTRDAVLEKFAEYCESETAKGSRLNHLTRHILGLYHGQYGGKAFRRHIGENVIRKDASCDILPQALSHTKLL